MSDLSQPVAPVAGDAILKVNDAGRVVVTPRRPPASEIESIKRTLYNAIDKLERLQRRELTTT